MTAEVIELAPFTGVDLDPKRVLRRALELHLSGVVVIGWEVQEDGNETFYAETSICDGGDVTWLLRKLELALHGVPP